MKYLIFLKELFYNKTTKNYLLIMFLVIFIINISINIYMFGKKILNDNYKNSYFITTLDNDIKYEKLKKHNNIDVISEYSKENKTYYITLKNWRKYNDLVDFLIRENIEYEIFLNKENEINIEKYYDYFFYILLLIIIICLIIYFITFINIIIDEQKYNYMYYCLGFNSKKIVLILLEKIMVLMSVVILINAIINWIMGANYYYSLVIYAFLVIITLLTNVFLIIERRNKR